MGETVIKIEGLEKSFGGLHVLKGIDLEIHRGEVVCIIGACASYALFLISLIGLFVGLIVQCVRLVMDKAIDMRSELDLTV